MTGWMVQAAGPMLLGSARPQGCMALGLGPAAGGSPRLLDRELGLGCRVPAAGLQAVAVLPTGFGPALVAAGPTVLGLAELARIVSAGSMAAGPAADGFARALLAEQNIGLEPGLRCTQRMSLRRQAEGDIQRFAACRPEQQRLGRNMDLAERCIGPEERCIGPGER